MERPSTEELDLLMESLKEADEPVIQRPNTYIRRYDFRSPDKFSKEQIRTLLLIHDTFARSLSTSLSSYLRTVVEMEPISVSQSVYRDFTDSLHEPSLLAVISLSPLPSRMLVEFEPGLAYLMVDRLLGGPGVAGSSVRRAMTEIEITVVRRIFGVFFEALADAWSNVEKIEPKLDSLESTLLFAQFLPPSETVVQITLKGKVGGEEGNIRICFPYLLLEPVLPRLSAQHWFAREAKLVDAEESGEMIRRLQDVYIPITVELGSMDANLADVVSLQVGDVLILDRQRGDLHDMFANGRLKFRGEVGVVRRKRLAVRIMERVGEEDEPK